MELFISKSRGVELLYSIIPKRRGDRKRLRPENTIIIMFDSSENTISVERAYLKNTISPRRCIMVEQPFTYLGF